MPLELENYFFQEQMINYIHNQQQDNKIPDAE